MKTPPRDIDDSMIADALRAGWGIEPAALRYLQLGFGSHHWSVQASDGGRWFATVDDLRSSHLGRDEPESFQALEVAFRTANKLHAIAGLTFVVGPISGTDGEVLIHLGDRYTIAVFPYLDVEPGEFGEFRNASDRDDAMRLVGSVHNATGMVDVDVLRRDTLAVQDRDRLNAALSSLDEPWSAGPYAEPARMLLRNHAGPLQEAIARFDALASSVMRDDSDWVVTHGEPHAANAIRTRAGEMVMVDWDTVAFGPRERDLWMLVDDDHPEWAAYREVTGVMSLSGEALAAYRMHWSLSEIAIYTGWCRDEHEGTEDMEIAWHELQRYLADLGRAALDER